MKFWICQTCAVEQPDSEEPPATCPICSDDRQYVRPSGQQWTTLAGLLEAGRRGEVDEVEPGLWGVTIVPSVGIGQRALLVQTEAGNLLWDATGYVDADLVEAIKQIGGLAAIASSHPHMFRVHVEWSHRFGGVPVFVQERDAEWLQRNDAVISTWAEAYEVLPGLTLHRIGGHLGGAFWRRRWSRGAAERGRGGGHPRPALGVIYAQLSQQDPTIGNRGGRGLRPGAGSRL